MVKTMIAELLALVALSTGCQQQRSAVYRFVDEQSGQTVAGDFGIGRPGDFSRGILIIPYEDRSLKVFWNGQEPLEWEVGATGYEWRVVLLTPGEHTVALKSREKPSRELNRSR